MNGTKQRVGIVFGVLAAVAGFEHGVGEALQGPVAPPDWRFASWPDVAALDPLAGEPAMSLIPDLLVTGVVTMVVSVALLAVVLRRQRDLRTRLTTALLSVALLLVGGGFFPPLFGLVAAALTGTGARAGAPTGGTARGTGLLVAYASKYVAPRQPPARPGRPGRPRLDGHPPVGRRARAGPRLRRRGALVTPCCHFYPGAAAPRYQGRHGVTRRELRQTLDRLSRWWWALRAARPGTCRGERWRGRRA